MADVLALVVFSRFYMNNNILKIKLLFRKLYSAYIWASTHPQEKHPERWNKKLLPYLDEVYDELEELGVWRGFSMALFAFGIEYVEAMRAWKDENSSQSVKQVDTDKVAGAAGALEPG